jgi:hypothetical protein
MKKSRLAFAFFLLLSSCASQNPPAPAPFDYSQEGKINLDVRDLTFVDRGIDQMPPSPPITTFKPSIADALHNWASQRLQAAGSDGIAAFVVKNAYVTEANAPVDSGWFDRPQSGKLTGHVEIEFDARGKQGYALATANAARSVTLPQNASEDEKQAAYNTLLNGMMQDLDKYLDQAIHEHLKDFIIGDPVVGSKLPSPEAANPAP